MLVISLLVINKLNYFFDFVLASKEFNYTELNFIGDMLELMCP